MTQQDPPSTDILNNPAAGLGNGEISALGDSLGSGTDGATMQGATPEAKEQPQEQPRPQRRRRRDSDDLQIAQDSSDDDTLDFGPPDDDDETPAAPARKPAAAAKPETPAPAAESISDALKNRARESGFTDEDLADFTSPRQLERALDAADRQLAKVFRSQRTEAAEKPGEQKPAAKPEPKPGDDEFQIDLSDEEYDPKLVKTIRGIHEHYGKQINELKSHYGRIAQAEQAREMQQFQAEVDRLFTGVASEYGDIFGDAKRDALTPETPEFKARIEVLTEMDVLAAGYRAVGRKVPSDAELFDRAIRVLHGGKTAERTTQRTRKEVSDRLRDREGQFVARPSPRNAPAVNGDAAALRTIETFTKNGTGDSDDEFDGGLL